VADRIVGGGPRVLLVNREQGAGARQLLDRALEEAGIHASSVRGYENVVRGHEEVARAVASGDADAGVSSACVAAAYGLDFIPLQEVRYDLAIVRAYLEHPSVRQLLATLDHRWVRLQFSVLGGYNTDRTGATVAEVKAA
jgi:putative molybdopterin biosynthesis protein